MFRGFIKCYCILLLSLDHGIIIMLYNNYVHAEPPNPTKATLNFESEAQLSLISLEGYLHWSIEGDDREDTADLNTSYMVTVIPESVESNLSVFTTSNTSIQLILSNDWEYNISVVAKNCVGTSEPAEIYITWDG